MDLARARPAIARFFFCAQRGLPFYAANGPLPRLPNGTRVGHAPWHPGGDQPGHRTMNEARSQLEDLDLPRNCIESSRDHG